jgi:hypothetical protein
MTTVNIEPTKDHPVPFDTTDEKTATYLDEITVAANTAEVQVALGAPLEVDPDNLEREKALIEAATKRKKSGALKNVNTAFAAGAFLRTYGQQAALDVATARSAITNKLMEIANCGDPRYELKALELLGKHSDIGLFTERSEITINYKDPQDLENAIKERIKRLLNADVTDVTPIGADLDEELGVADVPVEEVEPQAEQDVVQDIAQSEEEDGDEPAR